MGTKRPSLEELVQLTKEHGPKALQSLKIRLQLKEAEKLCNLLKFEGMDIQPFDFPGTMGVWKNTNSNSIKYTNIATKELIKKLAVARDVDYGVFEGFKTLIPDLTFDTFTNMAINQWGTTLHGMLTVYERRYTSAILDLINHDDEFKSIRDIKAYDFQKAPLGSWSFEGKPSKVAREAVKQLMIKIANEQKVDYKNFEEFKKMLPGLTQQKMHKTEINRWGTTLEGLLSTLYKGSVSFAIMDLVYNDDEFLSLKDIKLEDFNSPSQPKWIRNGKPTPAAREAVKQIIKKIANEKGLDYKTFEGFKQILPEINTENFLRKKNNKYDSTCAGTFSHAYGSSPSKAVLDLIANDEEFTNIRDIKVYDFPVMQLKAWKKDGRPTEIAREVIKHFIKKLAEEKNIDYTTFRGFKKILPEFGREKFHTLPINRWGTTAGSVLTVGYKNSPSAAVLDLIANDDEFTNIRDLKAYDFKMAPQNMWINNGKPTNTARETTKQLITKIANEKGLDYKTFEGFKILISEFTQKKMQKIKINRWGTTLNGMLACAYNNSSSDAVLDLIANDDEFTNIRDLKAYDFIIAKKNTWVNNGKPTNTARETTKQLITKIANEKGLDYKTFEGFKQILPNLTKETFYELPINRWETTLKGMLAGAYKNSPSDAVLDLIANDDEFTNIRDLKAYDFIIAKKNTWANNGKPTPAAREAVKQLITKIANEKGLDYKTFEGFKQILPNLTKETFYELPINRWETTLGGMIANAYEHSHVSAILDLLRHDEEFSSIKSKFNRENLSGQAFTRIERVDGKYTFDQLDRCISEQGLNLQKYGFYSFVNSEKREVRDLLTEIAQSQLGNKKIAYFGLEGPSFGSYFSLSKNIRVNTKKSLIPERNKRAFNVMSKIKKMRKVNKLLNGNSLYSLELRLQTAEEALKTTNKQFDLVFLDWLGHIAPTNIRELDLAYQHLNTPGVLAATINTAAISETRYQRQCGRTDKQNDFIHEWAHKNELKIQSLDYVGGDKKTLPMTIYIMTRKSNTI